jgi:DnaK suppressor protein
MDLERARELLAAEASRVHELLASSQQDRERDRDSENGEIAVSDAAEPLVAEGIDDAVTASLRQRLEALDRAEQRLAAGTFGRSVLSGDVIPDDRLEADPAAELTIEEARASER